LNQDLSPFGAVAGTPGAAPNPDIQPDHSFADMMGGYDLGGSLNMIGAHGPVTGDAGHTMYGGGGGVHGQYDPETGTVGQVAGGFAPTPHSGAAALALTTAMGRANARTPAQIAQFNALPGWAQAAATARGG
jgi:hypothetical protein